MFDDCGGDFAPKKYFENVSQNEPRPIERHFTVELCARKLNLSEDTVRRLFRNEPGVVHISRKTSNHARPKTANRSPRKWEMLLIPESVFWRVYRRLTGGAR